MASKLTVVTVPTVWIDVSVMGAARIGDATRASSSEIVDMVCIFDMMFGKDWLQDSGGWSPVGDVN